MSFVKKYFDRVNIFYDNFSININDNYSLIVVIPVYNEPNFLDTLKSLYYNDYQGVNVLVLAVINSAENCSEQIILQNIKTVTEIENFQLNNNRSDFYIKIVDVFDIPVKLAGPGFARKIGMDLALKYFDKRNNKNGLILSLDADTTVDENYFQEIFNYFTENKSTEAVNIRFEHPISGNDFLEKTYKAIVIYELYLRYFVQALRFANFPHAFHTIGSAFAVKAEVYAKQGGMVTNQSGEDFYFLHKIIPNGNFGVINDTCVYPSPRITDRVIFGTGVAVNQIINEYNFDYPSYTLQSFLHIKEFIEIIPYLYYSDFSMLNKALNTKIVEFLEKNKINKIIEETRRNTKTQVSFIKRFFYWFNGFRVIKFLNFYHKDIKKESILDEASFLFKRYDISVKKEANEMLNILRNIQKR